MVSACATLGAGALPGSGLLGCNSLACGFGSIALASSRAAFRSFLSALRSIRSASMISFRAA